MCSRLPVCWPSGMGCSRFEMTLHYAPAQPEDADELVALRVAAMRPSLEQLGRFDPQRARARFLQHYTPACTRHLVVGGRRVGVVVVRHEAEHLLLDHLYVHPDHQGQGIGAAVLADVLAQAETQGLPVKVTALRGSRSNDFYQRHGFVLVEESEWDLVYLRQPDPLG